MALLLQPAARHATKVLALEPDRDPIVESLPFCPIDEGRVADVDAKSPASRPSFDRLDPRFFWNAPGLAANVALPGAEEGKAEEGEQTDCPSGAAGFAHGAS
jgi:hypothetical protein